MVRLFGPRDSFLRQLRDMFDVKVVARGQKVSLEGPPEQVEACREVLHEMQDHLQRAGSLNQSVVRAIIEGEHRAEHPDQHSQVELKSFMAGRSPRPRTPGQQLYVERMLKDDIVFCIGPAGTGKTYLAVAVALDYLKRGELHSIVLCRPAVEAGEHLGFLPGDLRQKVNPYLRPLYDALHELMPPTVVRKYVENDLIEILPLAFVRGRTLDDALIILDEAQNCTVNQMKTFLTRLGKSAKLVVTGDITQVDLPPDEQSGLVDVQSRLRGIPGVSFVRLGTEDILRHKLVRRIVHAYQAETPGEAPESGQ